MGKGLLFKPSYIKNVSFADCKDNKAREQKREQLVSDNAVFLNSVLGLLTDLKNPFLDKRDSENCDNFEKSKRPELQDRIQTLSYIRNNREAWFKDGSYKAKKENVITIFEYLADHEDLFERSAICLKQEPDINLVVREALTKDRFWLNDDQNPARIAWDALSARTEKALNTKEIFQILES